MKKKNTVLVEYLYLDLNTCDRCMGTEEILREVIRALAPALDMAGCEIDLQMIEVKTEEMAAALGFFSSPTIRVNQQDICLSLAESTCGCCSEISGTDVDCRVFVYEGQTSEVPTREFLAQAILRRAFAPEEPCCCTETRPLPENLRKFFAGKREKEENKECLEKKGQKK